MKLETVKSFMLIVLVGISMILSLTLWSYQPNSDRTLGGEVVTEEMDVGGSDEESKGSMVKPTDIIFHTPDEYYGFVEAADRDTLFSEMQDWVLTNFETTTEDNTFVRSENGVELVFADEIPMEVMSSIFTFGEEDIANVLPTWSMNRIFIRFNHDSKSLYLEFISSDNNRISTAVINDTDSFDNLWGHVANITGETLRRYLAINENDNPAYFPAGTVSLPTYSITPIDINPGLFVNILFSNPSVVRETTSQSIGETYFTDSRQMSVYYNRMRMEYRNHATPTTEEGITITKVDLLDRSIADINTHSGWNEDYRLEEFSLDQSRVTYRLHYEGYPIFNNSKLSIIQQRWGVYQNSYQLLEYDRPLYSFGSEFSLSGVNNLTSGEDVIAYLQNDADTNIENIQDIKVSYELRYQSDEQGSEYFDLEPSWFKKENNNWQRIVFEEHSGPKGVE